MNNIEKIIEYIRADSVVELEGIAQKAVEDCERIRSEYARAEQDEYWKAINAGTRETEQRLAKLSELAAMEAQKQLDALYVEMLDKAFALAAEKLRELSLFEYDELLSRLGIEAGCGAEDLVERYRSELLPEITSALFD